MHTVVPGFRFNELVVESEKAEEKTNHFLVFPHQKAPIETPSEATLSKIIDLKTNPSYITFIGVPFKSLGYQSITDKTRIYFGQHPDDEKLILAFMVSHPNNILQDVRVDLKRSIPTR
jgi:hypothetical protein